MASADDILKKWRSKDGIQPLEDPEDVRKVLRHLGFKVREGAKHSIIASHEILNRINDQKFGRGRHLNVPTVSGRKVKKKYIKILISIVDRIEDENETR